MISSKGIQANEEPAKKEPSINPTTTSQQQQSKNNLLPKQSEKEPPNEKLLNVLFCRKQKEKPWMLKELETKTKTQNGNQKRKGFRYGKTSWVGIKKHFLPLLPGSAPSASGLIDELGLAAQWTRGNQEYGARNKFFNKRLRGPKRK